MTIAVNSSSCIVPWYNNSFSLDDENRVVLSPCGAFRDDYVNASPIDVSSMKII